MYICNNERINVMIRKPEQLKALFQQTKEKKEKELQRKKEEKQQQYQQLCKQADQLLKEDQERLKKEKMEQFQALTNKTPQKQREVPYINLFSQYIETDSFAYAIQNINRRKLKQMEMTGEYGKINWLKWNEVVERTKQDIQQYLVQHNVRKKPKKASWQVLQITPTGEKIVHLSALEASKQLNLSLSCIRLAAAGKYYKTHDYNNSKWYYNK